MTASRSGDFQYGDLDEGINDLIYERLAVDGTKRRWNGQNCREDNDKCYDNNYGGDRISNESSNSITVNDGNGNDFHDDDDIHNNHNHHY